MAFGIRIFTGAIYSYLLLVQRWLSFGFVGATLEQQPRTASASTSVPKLEDLIVKARVEWPNGENRYFVPVDEFKNLITVDTILSEFKRCQSNVSDNDEDALREISAIIFKSCPKIFALLTLLGHAQSIRNFLEEGIHDTHLPFFRHNTNGKNGVFRLYSKKSDPREPLRCIEEWDRLSVEALFRDQWSLLSPEFQRSLDSDAAPIIEHKELHANCVLPFIKDMEHSDTRHEGGFSTVWEVEIHPAHHTLLICTGSKNPSFALKKLHSTKRQDFESEKEMHTAFRKSKNPYLVQLLATYSLNGSYYMLFPYAKSNLRIYWKDNPEPIFDKPTLLWVANQCKALTQGLLRIHKYSDTIPLNGRRNPLADHLYGRHGDIKPENILWSVESPPDQQCQRKEKHGILVIADFGLMAFHRGQSRSLVPGAKLHGTAAYAPPECQLNMKVSRSYDIWSLGCVYLEFITWIVCGWTGLERFLSIRSGADSGKLGNDCFYTTIYNKHGAASKAELRESVQEWMKELQHQSRCSDLIEDLLDLVSLMLVVDPKKRINAGQLNSELSQIIKAGKNNANYLTERNRTTTLTVPADTSPPTRSSNLIHFMPSLHSDVGHQLPTS